MLDAPVHTTLRRSMIGPFRPGAVGALEPAVRSLARARLDQLADRDTFDVRHDYASFVSAAVAAYQLGFPVEDATRMVTLVNRYVRREPGRAGFGGANDEARGTLDEFMVDLVASRRRAPHAEPVDALDGLLTFDLGDGPLTDEPLTDGPLDRRARSPNSSSRCSSAARRRCPKVVAGGAYELWKDPEQRRALVDDPRPRRAPSRRCSATTSRSSSSAARCSSTPRSRASRCAPGSGSCSCSSRANRDEREFADPERFDSTRLMERHLGLGHGVHVCIGAHVARLEGTVMLQELLARHPGYEVDDADAVPRGLGVPRELGRGAHRGALTG